MNSEAFNAARSSFENGQAANSRALASYLDALSTEIGASVGSVPGAAGVPMTRASIVAATPTVTAAVETPTSSTSVTPRPALTSGSRASIVASEKASISSLSSSTSSSITVTQAAVSASQSSHSSSSLSRTVSPMDPIAEPARPLSSWLGASALDPSISLPWSEAASTITPKASSASSSPVPSATHGLSAGVQAAIALGAVILLLIIAMTAGILWRRQRRSRRQQISELPIRDDQTIGRFELGTGPSHTATRRGSCEKPIENSGDTHPANRCPGMSHVDAKVVWRPWRWSRWRGRQELDGGWRPPEMQGRKFHEKGVA
ncbi:MAG: hypothetical protein Q9195_003853 [Heterodermia aff. obscurata]